MSFALRSSRVVVPPLRIAERVSGCEAGYALLAVLCISVGIAGLALLISAAARNSIAPSRNRIALAAASWSAAGCLAQARAVLAEALGRDEPQTDAPAQVWDRVDRALKAWRPSAELACALEARAVGTRVDVNASDEATLARLLRFAGMPGARADSAAGAIASHKPYVDLRELHLVPGLESATLLDSVPDVPGASARLPGLVVFQPVAWLITVRASAGRPAVTAVVEVRLARSGAGTAVTRHRSWIE